MVRDAFILIEIARYRDSDMQLLSCTALFFCSFVKLFHSFMHKHTLSHTHTNRYLHSPPYCLDTGVCGIRVVAECAVFSALPPWLLAEATEA